MYTTEMLATMNKQVEETIYLLETTVKPDTFFSRYDFLFVALDRLMQAGERQKATQMIAEYKNDKTLDGMINKLIERSHERLLKDVSTAKTEKGRVSKINKYFDEIEKFSAKMFPSNVMLLKDKKKQHSV